MHGAPDMIAAVMTADGTWAGAAGIDGPKGREAEPTDEFGIASVSKVVLAALVLKLVDKGKIELDAPIARYLEGVDVDANKATVRQALGMRSGIGGTPDGVINKATWTSVIDRGRPRTSSAPCPPRSRSPARGTSTRTRPTSWSESLRSRRRQEDRRRAQLLVLDGSDSDLSSSGRRPRHPRSRGHCRWKGARAASTSRGPGAAATCRRRSRPSLGYIRDRQRCAYAGSMGLGPVRGRRHLGRAPPGDDDHGHGRSRAGIDRLDDFFPDVAYGHAGSQAGYSALLTILPERHAVIVVLINDETADPFTGYEPAHRRARGLRIARRRSGTLRASPRICGAW